MSVLSKDDYFSRINDAGIPKWLNENPETVGAFNDKRNAEFYLQKVKPAGFDNAFIVECER